MESPGSPNHARFLLRIARSPGAGAARHRLVRLNARARLRPGHGEVSSCNRHAARRTLRPGGGRRHARLLGNTMIKARRLAMTRLRRGAPGDGDDPR
jgi:hypothetical protein